MITRLQFLQAVRQVQIVCRCVKGRRSQSLPLHSLLHHYCPWTMWQISTTSTSYYQKLREVSNVLRQERKTWNSFHLTYYYYYYYTCR
jgi:hypothetical protein